jgi:hypothetical protein
MPYQNIDIEVDDFLESCSSSDIREIIEWLKDNDHIKNDSDNHNSNNISCLEYEWEDILTILKEKRLSLTSEDEQVIKNIVKRFI